MTYPTSFASLPDVQALGPLGIPVYASAAQLALEQSIVQPGQMAAIQNPAFSIVQAVGTAPAEYVTKSTSSTQLAGGGATVYWVALDKGSVSGQGTPNTCRAMATVLAAYAGSGTGTLTASATGAIGTQDGVTLVAGDQLFVPAGLTHVTAVDSGPWTVVNPGATGVKYVLTRPSWFETGNLLGFPSPIRIGPEGSVFNNTSFRATAGPTTVVDTTDCAFYVDEFTFQVTLSQGTRALAAGQPLGTNACPVGIFSATQSNVLVSIAVAGGTQTTTVSYGAANSSSSAIAVPGYVGTASFAVFALAAAQTTQTGDSSKVNVTIKNFG